MSKFILCVDFDGVIHSYTTKWQGAHWAPDPPTVGAMAFLIEACRVFDVQVFSSRSNQSGGILCMSTYIDHWLGVGTSNGDFTLEEANGVRNQVKFPTEKPPAMVTIDDRAWRFDGKWPSIEELKKFKPWNR
jgi:hypothetical protein